MDKFSATSKHYLKILTILAIATMLSLGIYEHKTKMVNICIDDKKMTVKTIKSTVGELLKKEGIKVVEGGYINLEDDKKLKDDMTIVIKTPKTYKLKMNGKVVEIKSTEDIVENILKNLKIELDDDDYTYPDLKDKVNPMDEIEVVKIDKTIEVVKNEIPFETIVRNTKKLNKGTSVVVQEGKNGLKEVEIKKVFKNEELLSENVFSEKIVAQPVPKIVEKGTKDYLVSSRGNIRYKKSFTVTATAYDLSYASCGKTPGDKGYGITASGTKARPGVVSVDPRVIPLGTKLYIESLDGRKDYGFAIAEDTGGAIKGNRVDLFFPNSKDAKKFGRRKVKVYILEN